MEESTSHIHAISKVLSSNDTGKSGAHQAGILIPKQHEVLTFFPYLDQRQKNPYRMLEFIDENGIQREFKYIYYNNRFFGGTRNEFRLTRMTGYIHERNLEPGDEILLAKDDRGKYSISYRKETQIIKDAPGTITLGSGWKVIKIKK